MIANSRLCVTGAIKAELNSSLQTPPADSETGPLRWKLREVNSPQVCQLAKKYLCIPATSTPAERVFSTCGNIVICHTVDQHWSQIQWTGLFFWCIRLTLMYVCQSHFALFKKQVGNASLFFWYVFCRHRVRKLLVLECLFHLQAQHLKMNSDNLILLIVHVQTVLHNSRMHYAFFFGI